MKLSKSLLKAILVGATIGGTAACSFVEDHAEVQVKDLKVEESTIEAQPTHEKSDRCDFDPFDCPACGMG